MSANEFWNNPDGLNVRFGLEKGQPAAMGSVERDGDLHELRVAILDATAIPALASADVIGTQPLAGVPSDARIESCSLYVTTAFTSAGLATLDVGLFNDDGDGTYSASDANGLIVASAKAGLVVDAKIVGAGAQVGTTPTGTGGRNLYVSYNYNTAAFTAGAGELIILYRI